MKEKKFNYFYKIENKINGNFYYGVHKTDNLEDGYMGSGMRIGYAIKKYSVENFKKENLLFFETYNEALNYEAEVVNEELLIDSSCYNLTLGGNGGWYYINNVKYKDGHTFNENKVVVNIDGKLKKVTHEEFINNHLISHHKNYACFKNEDGKLFYLNVNDEKITELNLSGITKNKFLVKDKNQNCFIVNKDDERLLNGEVTAFWKDRKHKEETKKKIGLKNSIKQKGIGNSQYGTCWITDGKSSKKIHKGDLIPDGWQLGRKMVIVAQ